MKYSDPTVILTSIVGNAFVLATVWLVHGSGTWSVGETPQFSVGITHPGFVEDSRNTNKDSCANFSSTEGDEELSFLFKDHTVPSDTTSYVKYAFNLADLVTEQLGENADNDPYFGVRFQPVIKNPSVVRCLGAFLGSVVRVRREVYVCWWLEAASCIHVVQQSSRISAGTPCSFSEFSRHLLLYMP